MTTPLIYILLLISCVLIRTRACGPSTGLCTTSNMGLSNYLTPTPNSSDLMFANGTYSGNISTSNCTGYVVQSPGSIIRITYSDSEYVGTDTLIVCPSEAGDAIIKLIPKIKLGDAVIELIPKNKLANLYWNYLPPLDLVNGTINNNTIGVSEVHYLDGYAGNSTLWVFLIDCPSEVIVEGSIIGVESYVGNTKNSYYLTTNNITIRYNKIQLHHLRSMPRYSCSYYSYITEKVPWWMNQTNPFITYKDIETNIRELYYVKSQYEFENKIRLLDEINLIVENTAPCTAPRLRIPSIPTPEVFLAHCENLIYYPCNYDGDCPIVIGNYSIQTQRTCDDSWGRCRYNTADIINCSLSAISKERLRYLENIHNTTNLSTYYSSWIVTLPKISLENRLISYKNNFTCIDGSSNIEYGFGASLIGNSGCSRTIVRDTRKVTPLKGTPFCGYCYYDSIQDNIKCVSVPNITCNTYCNNGMSGLSIKTVCSNMVTALNNCLINGVVIGDEYCTSNQICTDNTSLVFGECTESSLMRMIPQWKTSGSTHYPVGTHLPPFFYTLHYINPNDTNYSVINWLAFFDDLMSVINRTKLIDGIIEKYYMNSRLSAENGDGMYWYGDLVPGPDGPATAKISEKVNIFSSEVVTIFLSFDHRLIGLSRPQNTPTITALPEFVSVKICSPLCITYNFSDTLYIFNNETLNGICSIPITIPSMNISKETVIDGGVIVVYKLSVSGNLILSNSNVSTNELLLNNKSGIVLSGNSSLTVIGGCDNLTIATLDLRSADFSQRRKVLEVPNGCDVNIENILLPSDNICNKYSVDRKPTSLEVVSVLDCNIVILSGSVAAAVLVMAIIALVVILKVKVIRKKLAPYHYRKKKDLVPGHATSPKTYNSTTAGARA